MTSFGAFPVDKFAKAPQHRKKKYMQYLKIKTKDVKRYIGYYEGWYNTFDKDGYKYTDEEKKFWRKDYIALIKFLILLIIAVSLGTYFFGDGYIDYSRYSEGNYMRP